MSKIYEGISCFGENDIIGIQFDAQNTKQYAVSFQTTPYGNQRDAQIFNDNNTDNDWNALWYVKTQRSEDGYYAEFAIPFKSLRYDKPEAGKGEPITGNDDVPFSQTGVRTELFPGHPTGFFPVPDDLCRQTYRFEGSAAIG